VSAPPISAGSLPDTVQEALRLLQAADGLYLKLLGGVAVALRCPSASRAPLARAYKDIDFVVGRRDREGVKRLFDAAGYEADRHFNAIHGHQRLEFTHPVNLHKADIFIDRVSMCHELELAGRLDGPDATLPPADLLLLKLQVVETNERDFQDATALFADHDLGPQGIDVGRIVDVLASDWGWWRTATTVLRATRDYAAGLEGLDRAEAVCAAIDALLGEIDAAPKSRRWKMRARVGDRVRWYELPDDVG
jgi:hypothetical protein